MLHGVVLIIRSLKFGDKGILMRFAELMFAVVDCLFDLETFEISLFNVAFEKVLVRIAYNPSFLISKWLVKITLERVHHSNFNNLSRDDDQLSLNWKILLNR